MAPVFCRFLVLTKGYLELEAIASILMTKEIIHHDEIRELLGSPATKIAPDHERFISQKFAPPAPTN